VVTKVINVTGILITIFILAPTVTTVQSLWYCISNFQYFSTYKVERQTYRQIWPPLCVPFLEIIYKHSTNKLLDRHNYLNTHVA
jgi:hypothetical protein